MGALPSSKRLLSGDTLIESDAATSTSQQHILAQKQDAVLDLAVDAQAISTLAGLMAQRRNISVEDAAGILVHVYCEPNKSPISNLDGTQEMPKDVAAPHEEFKVRLLKELSTAGIHSLPKVRGTVVVGKVPAAHIKKMGKRQEHTFRRVFSFERGPDTIQGDSSERNVSQTSPISWLTTTKQYDGQQEPKQETKEIAELVPPSAISGSSSMVSILSGSPAVRNVAAESRVSRIPSPNTKTKVSPIPPRMRNSSTSSVALHVDRWETLSEVSVNNASFPASRRLSAQMDGGSTSQVDVIKSTEGSGRPCPAKQLSHGASNDGGNESARRSSGINDVTLAVAAARVAESRAEERGKGSEA